MVLHKFYQHLGVKLRLVVHDEKQYTLTFAQVKNFITKNLKNMMMWKNALDLTWRMRVIEATRGFIDLQPKFMRAIIEAEGGRTPY